MRRSAFCDPKGLWNRVAACLGGFADLAQFGRAKPFKGLGRGFKFRSLHQQNAKTATVVCEKCLRPGSSENSAASILARVTGFGEELFVEPASS